MTRVLLTNTNSVWGIIVNPQTSNVYRHIINFKTDAYKEYYIGEQLFTGENWKIMIRKTLPVAWTWITAVKASFRIDPADYKGDDMQSLLNKDYAIVLDGSTYLYYTVFGTRVKNLVHYKAELDIFMTYNIKNMFNNKKAQIDRAHYDNYTTINNKLTMNKKGPIYNSESIDTFNQSQYFPLDKGRTAKVIVPDKYIFFNNEIRTSTQRTQLRIDISKYLSDVKWKMVYKSKERDINKDKDLSYTHMLNYNGIDLPYAVYLAPYLKKESGVKATYLHEVGSDLSNINIYNWDLKTVAEKLSFKHLLMPKNFVSTKSDTIANGVNLTPNGLFLLNLNNIRFTIVENRFHIFYNTTSKNNNWYYHEEEMFSPQGEGRGIYNYMINLQNITKNTIPSLRFPIYPILNLTPDQNPQHDLQPELKTQLTPYTYFKLFTSLKSEHVIQPEYLNNTTSLELVQNYIFDPSSYGICFDIKDYGFNLDAYGINDKTYDTIQGYNLVDRSGFQLPSWKGAYDDYIVRNANQVRVQKKTIVATGVTRIVGGVLGGALSAATGNVPGALGSAASVASGATSLSLGLEAVNAKHSDLKNTPNTVETATGGLLETNLLTDFKIRLTKYQLQPHVFKIVGEYFYKNGYNYANVMHNINNLLSSRHWFNYIQVPESFENIKAQLSPEIKQVINDTLRNGITIWHCRDIWTFKGIKYYGKNNTQITY